MQNVHAGILALAALGCVFVGNALTDTNSLLAELLGRALSLFGLFLLFYCMYRAIRWVWKKVSGANSNQK